MSNNGTGIESSESFNAGTTEAVQANFVEYRISNSAIQLTSADETLSKNGFLSNDALLNEMFYQKQEHERKRDSATNADDCESSSEEGDVSDDLYSSRNVVQPIEGSAIGKVLTKEQVEQLIHDRKIERLVDNIENGSLLSKVASEHQLMAEGFQAIPKLARMIDDIETNGPRSDVKRIEKLTELAHRLLADPADVIRLIKGARNGDYYLQKLLDKIIPSNRKDN
ncbi:MAG: hypothetical protein K2Z81_19960 [Cyanobacteria bacterium]|nr:hypothetical protein [Cyanobacteriota bacterium]